MTYEDGKDYRVRGAGGGKGGGSQASHVASEDPDSLRSIQYARFIDVVCEGQVAGPANGTLLKSIFLGGVPIQNPDNSMNFSDVLVDYRDGTQTQTHLPGFPSTETAHTDSSVINVKIRKTADSTSTGPVILPVTNRNTDRVRVIIGIPQLVRQDTSTGDLHGSSVEVQFSIQKDGGGYVLQNVEGTVIEGKTTSRYQRSFVLTLPKPCNDRWDIKVERLTDDATQVNIKNETWVDSYVDIIDSKIQYVNRVVFGIQIDASQFSTIPTRGYLLKGLLVRVPNNYDPVTRSYNTDGDIWRGGFKVAWTDNPVWCYYDLLLNERYGLGEFVDATMVDKWGLYVIAQYCDHLVPDGFGGVEPRFTCNTYIQSADDAYKVLQMMTNIFRAISYWANGSIITAQDAPSVPSNLYNPSNIVGDFRYQGTALTARHTVAHVVWNDPHDQYRQSVEYVEDEDGIRRYGYIKTDTTAFACTSRGQAHRWGKWLLFTERMETEVVTFNVGFDGILSPPGSLIKTTDPSRAKERLGGRLLFATTNTFQLDAPVTLAGGVAYTLNCVLPDGNVGSQTVIEGPGTYTTLHTSAPFPLAPSTMAIWILESVRLLSEVWRVLSVTEIDTGFEVNAVTHVPGKYALIEDGVALEPRIITGYKRPEPPTDLSVQQAQVTNSSGLSENHVTFSWHGTTGTYEVSYKITGGNWIVLPTTHFSSVDLGVLVAGHYFFSVVQISAGSLSSFPAQIEADITGGVSGGVVPDITGLRLYDGGTTFRGKDAKITWDDVPGPHLWFKFFIVTIYNADGVTMRRQDVTTDVTYIYSYERNYEDSIRNAVGGVVRSFIVTLVAQDFAGNRSVHPQFLLVSNPAPPLPTAVAVNGITNYIFFDYTPPPDTDYAGIIVWLSQTSGFTPASPGNEVYRGVESKIILAVPPQVTPATRRPYYIRYAAFDTFGADQLNYSGELSAVTGAIERTNITDFAIDTPQLNANAVRAGNIFVENLAAIKSWLGDVVAGSITMDTSYVGGNYIRGGQSWFNQGIGFFLGYDPNGGVYKFSIGNPAGARMVWDGSNLLVTGWVSDLRPYEPGSIYLAHSPTVVDNYRHDTPDGTWTKLKEIKVPRSGQLYVTWQQWATIGYGGEINGRVYVNGAAYGSIRQNVGFGGQWVTHAEYVSVNPGDNIQLWGMASSAANSGRGTPPVSETIAWKNFRLSCSFYIAEVVTQTEPSRALSISPDSNPNSDE